MALIDANPRSRIKPRGLRTNRSLIELRLNAGLTPNDLARRAQVSGNTVRSAERGLYVDPRSQYAIASALGVRPLDVFPFERQREALR
jgi:transcriptional regulator with XRE-family HTH domain